MASSNLTLCTGVLSPSDCARGVTTGTTKPNGGLNFVYAMNSRTAAAGSVALFANQASFAPMASGADVSAAMVRLAGGGPAGWSCYLFAASSGPSVDDTCYMLGLSAGDPCHVELRKGVLGVGLPDETPLGANMVLRRSTLTVPIAEWTHLRLEVVVQPFGDVILNCYRSDLGAHAVSSPTWIAIPGMDPFTDDALGIATSSLPYTSGRAGFGMRTDDVTRRAAFDYLKVGRQTAP